VNVDPPSEHLRCASILRDLSPAERDRLFRGTTTRRYGRGCVVFHKGDPGHSLHLIRQGRVKVVLPGDSGPDAIVAILGPGDVFGEMALFDGEPRSATVVALEDVETLTLSRVDFLTMLHRNPAVIEAILGKLATTIRQLNAHVSDLTCLDLRGRLARKLLNLAESHGRRSSDVIELTVALTQEDLAEMIGATRARVSNVLGFFEDQRAITRRGRQLVILRPEALQRWGDCQ